MRILVVEDDPLLGRGVQAALGQAGFAADWVRDGVAADAALEAGEYAALILDLGLPRLEGLELLRRRRGRGDRTPVLILSARDALEDRVQGLDVGADDYLVKPFRVEELAARLRALVRRAHGAAAPVLSAAGVTLDPGARRVEWRGRAVELGRRPGGVTLAVCDQGTGIAPELRERVFESYYRIPGSPGDGSGLGLAIVREIAAEAGAALALGPGEHGGGTRIEVMFPAAA